MSTELISWKKVRPKVKSYISFLVKKNNIKVIFIKKAQIIFIYNYKSYNKTIKNNISFNLIFMKEEKGKKIFESNYKWKLYNNYL